MTPMAAQVTVLSGGAAPASSPRSQLAIAYEHFRLERQGELVSEKTLETYETHVKPFLSWVGECGVHRFADLDLDAVRTYRAQEATRIGKHGRKLRPHSVLDSHKAVLTFLRWAKSEGYEFDSRLLELKRPKVPKAEADVYHMSQLRTILAACNWSTRPAAPMTSSSGFNPLHSGACAATPRNWRTTSVPSIGFNPLHSGACAATPWRFTQSS